MSAGGSAQGALYSPLPQSITDTDSSEEELSNILHDSLNHAVNRKLVISVKTSEDKQNGYKMGDYRPLNHDVDVDVTINGLPSHGVPTERTVPCIKSTDPLPHHMEPASTIRKFCFVLSIILCVLTVITFLWILPCSLDSCPSSQQRFVTRSWEKTLSSVELKGRINVVPGLPGWGQSLLFLVRGDVVNSLFGSESNTGGVDSFPPSGGGIISLVGSTGAVAWWSRLFALPRDIDCTLIDIDLNGMKDCIVVGNEGLLAAIDPLSGTGFWYLHSHNKQDKGSKTRPMELDFPLLLPDLDDDRVNELVTPCSLAGERVYLLLVSGRQGRILGGPLRLSGCSRIDSLQLQQDWFISYTCQQDLGKGIVSKISLQELYTKATNKSFAKIQHLNMSRHIEQHKVHGHENIAGGMHKSSSFTVRGRKLTVENHGHCPSHCSVTVNVTDERIGQGLVWNYTEKNTYAMIPAILIFNNRSSRHTAAVSSEPVSGFVLKFWQWGFPNRHSAIYQSDPEFEQEVAKTLNSNPKFDDHLKWKLMAANRDSTHAHHPEENKSKRNSRSVLPTLKQSSGEGNSSHIVSHQLNERVLLITFNATDMHIVNASQSEVTQLCLHHGDDDPICQPDLTFQEQSLLIADLDQDGSQELISYLTTYTSKASEASITNPVWQLQSKVRAIRLEAELPKLYEAVTKIN